MFGIPGGLYIQRSRSRRSYHYVGHVEVHDQRYIKIAGLCSIQGFQSNQAQFFITTRIEDPDIKLLYIQMVAPVLVTTPHPGDLNLPCL